MNKYMYAALILFTTFLMGIAFPVGKIGLQYASPFLLMGIRFVLAGGLLALFVRIAKRPHPQSLKPWLQIAIIGVFQSAGVMGCAYYSMRWITSGESSILICINPLLVIILGTFLSGAKYRRQQWLGVLIGFIGVALTFGFQMRLQPGTPIGFAGAVSFASATLLVKRFGPAIDTWVLTAYQMLSGGLVLLLASVLLEKPHFTLNAVSALVVALLAILCSIVQFPIWFYLLKKGDPGKTSAFLFLVPVFGLLSGWALLGEHIKRYVWFGGALICVGIFLVNWQKSIASARSALPAER